MIESIRSGADRSIPPDSGSFTRRRTRSSSITSPSLFTSPTTPYQDSDQGRLGLGFSVLKLRVQGSQTPQTSLPKILALPPWLQDTINELGASHPLRVVFPAPHDASDTSVARDPAEDFPDYPKPRRALPNDINRSLLLPSTPPRIPPSTSHQQDSETSSDEPRPVSSQYPLYRNSSLLRLYSSPAPSLGALTRPKSTSPNASNPYPGAVAPIKVANAAHISRFKTTPLSASSLNHGPPVSIFPVPRPDVDYDGVFRYNLSQADSEIDLSPLQQFTFERPIQTYFDSPTEDPLSSDPLGPDDHDPFKLDPEECKNLSFKWAPFGHAAGVAETSTRSPDIEGSSEEVLISNGSSYNPTHVHSLLLGYLRLPGANGAGYIRTQARDRNHNTNSAINPSCQSVGNRQHHTTSMFRSSPAFAFVSQRSISWMTPMLCSPLGPYVSPHSS